MQTGVNPGVCVLECACSNKGVAIYEIGHSPEQRRLLDVGGEFTRGSGDTTKISCNWCGRVIED